MNIIREIIAVILFIVAILLTIYNCIDTFSWAYLILAIACYLAAYSIWPSKRQGQRDDHSVWLDIIELLIEIPFRIVRGAFRLFKESEVPGIDL